MGHLRFTLFYLLCGLSAALCQPIADETAYQSKLDKTREYLRPDSRVLEFGCGTGSTSIIHAPLVTHIEAVDISSKMLEIARAQAESAGVANVT